MLSKRLSVALFGNLYQTNKNASVYEVLQVLNTLGAEVLIESKFAKFINEKKNVYISTCQIKNANEIEADFAISMGGDGTFLKTAELIGRKNIPILGINTGRLGFLADVSPEEIKTALHALLQNDYLVEQRNLIGVEAEGINLPIYPFALNEVAVLKHDNSSVIEVNTSVNGEVLANYVADGLIICTPTGSTGYSLSAGGPIIEPRSQTFCISAVAPHSLSVRPVILCNDAIIKLKVCSRSEHFLISIDGRSHSLPAGTKLTLKKADYTVGVVKIVHKKIFDTLRNKMNWGVDLEGRGC